VEDITPFLTPPGAVTGKPHRLAANANKSFQGSIVLGLGLVLTPKEAETLIATDGRNRDVLFPYLNGEDLNSRPDQSPSRWVINFRNWPLRRGASGRWTGADDKQRTQWLRSGVVPDDYADPVAADYPDCLKIVDEKVKPERDRLASGDATARDRARRWWQFARPTIRLYATIAGMDRVLVRARIANQHATTWVPTAWVFNEKTVVFPFGPFGLLQSTLHEVWAREYSSSLRTDMQYTPSDCFETFPFPDSSAVLDTISDTYHAHRQSIMLAHNEGLTKTYNRFHDSRETVADSQRLRELQVEMDRAVAAAYRWIDLDLGHGFHETKQGLRFTISPVARRELLGRLLRLNHERYADEVRQGLHAKDRGRGGGAVSRDSEDGLFGAAADA